MPGRQAGPVRRVRLVQLVSITLICLVGASASAAISNIKLNGPLGTDMYVEHFVISPDGRWVVYSVEDVPAVKNDLYSVPITGGTPVKLNTLLPLGARIDNFQITPDSRYVVYIGPLDTTQVGELYRVSIDGPAHERIKLNGTLVSGGDVFEFDLSPDGSRVVYIADQDTDSVRELYSVPTAGPASAGEKINGPLVADGSVGTFEISPDSRRVVYWADQQVNLLFEIYSVPIEGPGSAWVKLNGPLVTGGRVNAEFVISPDSSRVVYRAEQLTPNLDELFSVPIDGPAGLGERISGPLPADTNVGGFRITPDSNRVLYDLVYTGPSEAALFTVPITGPDTEAKRISHEHSDHDLGSFRISPDSRRAVYLTIRTGDTGRELYSVPVDGPASQSIQISEISIFGETISSYQISADSSRVVFLGKQMSSKTELYSTPLHQWGLKKINRLLNPNEDLHPEFRVSPDGGHVAYAAQRIILFVSRNEFNLYTVPTDGPGTASITINRPMINTGGIWDFEYSPDGQCLVYTGDQDTDGVQELYVSSWRPTAVPGWMIYE